MKQVSIQKAKGRGLCDNTAPLSVPVHPDILDRWLSEANGNGDRPTAPGSIQCLRVEHLVAELRRIRGLIECISTVACSEAFRKLSQQGYGDIEELCQKALGK